MSPWLPKVFSAMVHVVVVTNATVAVESSPMDYMSPSPTPQPQSFRYTLTYHDDTSGLWTVVDTQQHDDTAQYPCTQLYPSEPLFSCLVNGESSVVLPPDEIQLDAFYDRIRSEPTSETNIAEQSSRRRRLDNKSVGGIALGVIFGLTLLFKWIQFRYERRRTTNGDEITKNHRDKDDSTTLNDEASRETTTSDNQV